MFLDIDKCFTNHRRIHTLNSYNIQRDHEYTYSRISLGRAVRDGQIPGIEAVCYVSTADDQRGLMVRDEKGYEFPFVLTQIESDTSFFRVFTPEITAGSWEAVSGSMNSMMLSESCAEKLFGDPASAVGQTLVSTSRRPYSQPDIPEKLIDDEYDKNIPKWLWGCQLHLDL